MVRSKKINYHAILISSIKYVVPNCLKPVTEYLINRTRSYFTQQKDKIKSHYFYAPHYYFNLSMARAHCSNSYSPLWILQSSVWWPSKHYQWVLSALLVRCAHTRPGPSYSIPALFRYSPRAALYWLLFMILLYALTYGLVRQRGSIWYFIYMYLYS